jgi:hypothetical protein
MPGELWLLFLVVSALLNLYQAAVSATPQEGEQRSDEFTLFPRRHMYQHMLILNNIVDFLAWDSKIYVFWTCICIACMYYNDVDYCK